MLLKLEIITLLTNGKYQPKIIQYPEAQEDPFKRISNDVLWRDEILSQGNPSWKEKEAEQFCHIEDFSAVFIYVPDVMLWTRPDTSASETEYFALCAAVFEDTWFAGT